MLAHVHFTVCENVLMALILLFTSNVLLLSIVDEFNVLKYLEILRFTLNFEEFLYTLDAEIISLKDAEK